jgi:hypothetical protein
MLAKPLADPRVEWRQQVVALIRRDFNHVLPDIGEDDIDWDAWQSLYEEGCSPKEAVDRAFLRVADC